MLIYCFLPSSLSHSSFLTSPFLLLCCMKNQLPLHLSTHAYFLVGTAISNPLHLLFDCSTLVPTSSSHTVASFLNSLLYPSLLQPCIVNTVYYSHLITFCTYSFFQFYLLLKDYLAINSHMHPTVPIYSSLL